MTDDDELRDELAEVLDEFIVSDHGLNDARVDAVLPVVRRFANAQVAAERERLRQVLNRLPGVYTVGPSNYDRVLMLWQTDLLAALDDQS